MWPFKKPKIDPDFPIKPTYYDPVAKVVFSVKREEADTYIIGGVLSEYLNDAHTSYCRFRIGKEVFSRSKILTKDSEEVIKEVLVKTYKVYRLRAQSYSGRLSNNYTELPMEKPEGAWGG